MSTAHAEHFEHGCLRLEDGAAADSANFDGGHGDGNLEVSLQARMRVSKGSTRQDAIW